MKTYTKKTILLCFLMAIYLAGSVAMLHGATGKATLLMKQADSRRDILFGSAAKRKYRHNWLRCIKKYQIIYSKYKSSKEAPWALFKAADLYSRLYRYSGQTRDIDQSVSLFRKVVASYKTHSLADDAQFRIGEIYYRQKKDKSHAYVEFLKVDIKFPDGDMRSKARARLEKLGTELGRKAEIRQTKKPGTDPPGPVPVKDIRHWSTQNYTRVVVDLEARVKYGHHLLKRDRRNKRPGRLYLDLENAKVNKDIDKSIPIKGDLLQRVRAGQYQKSTVRVVLDINSIGTYKIFHLYDPFRIVIDVRKQEGGRVDVATRRRQARKGIRKPGPDKSVSLARQLGLNVKNIVIDPGHGGKDPGTYLGRIREKDITLAMAKELASRIRKEIGCKVYLTRNKDVFLPLERRTAIANMKKADLFVSLHVNAHKNRRVHGIETYFLNMATDRNAVRLAARENATSEKNISDLHRIVSDLMLNTKIHESNRLAHQVEKGVVSGLNGRYRSVRSLGVKQAPFYVLIGAQMPAVLVETGFITNTLERKRLMTRAYQKKVALGITNGIKSYIRSLDREYQGG